MTGFFKWHKKSCNAAAHSKAASLFPKWGFSPFFKEFKILLLRSRRPARRNKPSSLASWNPENSFLNFLIKITGQEKENERKRNLFNDLLIYKYEWRNILRFRISYVLSGSWWFASPSATIFSILCHRLCPVCEEIFGGWAFVAPSTMVNDT